MTDTVPTPRTDEQVVLVEWPHPLVAADFARTLERENIALREQLQAVEKKRDRVCESHRVLMKQADERAESAEARCAELECALAARRT